MARNRQSPRTHRAYLRPLLVAACWIACIPMEAGAQPVAEVPTQVISRLEIVPDRDIGRAPDSLAQRFGSNVQTSAPAPSPTPNSPTVKRDSIKNGLLVGATVGAVLSVLSSKMADCPDSAEGSCPGTKALMIAFTTATGAAIGAGIDVLFAVDTWPGGATPAGRRRGLLVSSGIRW